MAPRTRKQRGTTTGGKKKTRSRPIAKPEEKEDAQGDKADQPACPPDCKCTLKGKDFFLPSNLQDETQETDAK